MIKLIILSIMLNINLSKKSNHSCDVILNNKYIYSNKNHSFSINFDSDSTYILESENLVNRAGTTGRWKRNKHNSIIFTPDETNGINISSEKNGRIKKIDFYAFFDLKNAKGIVKCKKGKSYINIENYTFSCR